MEERTQQAASAAIQAVVHKSITKSQTKEKISAMIETNRRFEAYQAEVQAFAQLGISFHDWLKLAPSIEVKPEKAKLMYIIPSQPLYVALQEDNFQDFRYLDFMYEEYSRVKGYYLVGDDLIG
jgi:hypothetical protein